MDTLAKAVQGDQSAFTDLYKHYRQEIFSFVLGRVRDRDQALDLTADVFMAAYSGITSFRLDSSFRTWVYAIAKHKLQDHYRKKGQEQQQFVPLAEDDNEISHSEQIAADKAPDSIAELEINLDLGKILQKLLPAEQEILLLHNVSGLKFLECAQVLNITEGYARVYHQRALMKARRLSRSI